MGDRMKNRLVTASFFFILSALTVVNLILPDQELSYSERRRLLAVPAYSMEKLLSGELFEQYEKYFLDQFAFREQFRSLKAFFKLYLLQQKDNNRIYIVNGKLYKMEYPLSEKSIQNAAEKLNAIYERYLQGMNVSYAVIPDKNYFAAAKYGYLLMDYDELLNIMHQNVKNMNYIDLLDCLEDSDYYRTDIHWSQDKIIKAAEKLLTGMGNDVKLSEHQFERRELYPFYGALYRQAALRVQPDTLVYLTNDALENAVVYDHASGTYSKVYRPELFEGIDPYDVFLSGAKPLLTIYNPASETDKELILFRDSFGSSIAPLLLSGYGRITLVDIRYISPDILDRYIDFSQGQDVLFLYSTQILNNSAMLK